MSKKRNKAAGRASGNTPAQKQEAVKAAGTEEKKQEAQEQGQNVQKKKAETQSLYSEDAYAASEEVPEEAAAECAEPEAEHISAAAPAKEETPVAAPEKAEDVKTENAPDRRKQASHKKQKTTAKPEAADGQQEQSKGQSDRLFGTLIRKIIFCAALGIFCYALSGLLVLLWGYYSSQKEYRDLNNDVAVIGTTGAPENSSSNPGELVIEISGNDQEQVQVPYLDISVDEEKLKALNQDYAFYIVIPGTNIQYPVVQGDDNSHYLRYTYSNQENTAGSIALDYRTDRNTYLESFNTIISGHNRQDGTMFSDLANYKEESFRDQYPYVYIIMDGKEYVYEFYSFYAMEPVAVCYNPKTADDVYLDFTKENNTYTNDIDVTLEDHIITMYTCNEDSSMRYLCHAVLRAVYNLK
jgi:sortase B